MPATEPRPRITMQDVDGVTLRTAFWAAKNDVGNRPLLFFNGIGANLELTSALGDMFPDRDIVTFDVPGVGKSPVTQWPYRPWMLARWARKLLDQFHIDEVDVMGVSWGGALAQQFAFQYRNRVGKLILCATTAGMTMIPGKPASLSKMVDARRYTDPNYMRDNFATLYGDEADEQAGSHIDNLMAPDPKGYIFQLLAFIGWSSLPFIRFLRMPTLVMMGDKDSIVPLANGHILKVALPNSRLHVVEGGGHLFLVTRAEETAAVIRDFLAETQEVPSRAAA
ncbi:MAG: alpha/beta fold hydrolase [Alphaproteobacteria bacterium]|nr:alpha/beta fold hydrolase [Alphaproteobacteria bacterium]MBU2083161.1 alpha/beta fold hydrolase [Alphaproteobacteria bacterium]MBU2144540.1 alpha/beta fold hydrolase [Alphaproteobacteria bacterium]MBU2195445.1 alpha/beta fold hydrolase [Alphaproteobacteria bacterium]